MHQSRSRHAKRPCALATQGIYSPCHLDTAPHTLGHQGHWELLLSALRTAEKPLYAAWMGLTAKMEFLPVAKMDSISACLADRKDVHAERHAIELLRCMGMRS